MPEFKQEDQRGYRIVVHFDTLEDLYKFGEVIGQTLTEKTKWIHYPMKENQSYAEKIYQEDF